MIMSPDGPSTRTPAFFDSAPRIVVMDSLALLLGAVQDGAIEYTYGDAVKLCGHSCPTVASAWLMTRAALARLYGGDLPRRGDVRVEMREPEEAGVAGVMASVAGMVTGAAGSGGFKGLAGRHSRRNLLAFGVPIRGEMRFTRTDTGAGVDVSHHMEAAPRPAELGVRMQEALSSPSDGRSREAFARAWQDWVRAILVDHADDDALVRVVAAGA